MPKQLNTLGTLVLHVLLTAMVGLVSKDPVTRVPKIAYIDVVSMSPLLCVLHVRLLQPGAGAGLL